MALKVRETTLSGIKAVFDTNYARYYSRPEISIPSNFGVTIDDLYIDSAYRYTKDLGFFFNKEFLYSAYKRENVKRALEFLKKVENVENIPFKLMPHQEAAIIDGMARAHYGIFFEMRLGKTITALILSIFWCYLHDDVRTILVLAPLSAVETWEREAKRIKEPINIINIPFMNGKNGKEIELQEDKINLIITNYEYLRTKKAPTLLSKLKIGEYILILDEGHRVKNIRTKTHKISYMLSSNARKVLLLTGTPLGSGIEDIYGIAKCLHSEYLLGVRSLEEFREIFMFQVGDRFWKPKREAYD